MTVNHLDQEARSAERRLSQLAAQAEPLSPDQRAVLEEAVETLSRLREELHANAEALQDRQDQLAAAQTDLETAEQRHRSESRRLMNEKQRQSMFLERLMEVAPVGIAVVREQAYRFEMANAYFRAIPGAERPLVGRTFSEVFAQTSAGRVARLLDQACRTARPVHLREHQDAWGGEEGTYWNVDLVPLQDLTGAVNGVLMLARDVSREVRSRQEVVRLAEDLQQERDKLQTIMENTHAQLAYLDADFTFVHVNTAYAEDAGYKKEELIGRNHFDLFPDAENESIFRQVMETGKPVSFRGRPFVYSDQPERGVTYWDWSLVPVKDEEGETEGLVFSLLNVTERERLMKQLDAQQSRLNAIIENTPEGIVVVDDQARITLTNPAADQMYARDVPYGEDYASHGDLCLCHPDGTACRPRDLPLTRAALDGEAHEDLELALIRPGGEKRDLLASTAPIRNRAGEITGAVGIFRDITERKRIEEALRQHAERLRVLHELDQAILVTHSAEEIAEVTLDRLRELVRCQRASVELFDFEGEEAYLLAVDAAGETRLRKGRRTPFGWHRSLDELRAGRAYVVEDLDQVPISPTVEALRQEGIRSFVSLPLRTRDGLMGGLNVGKATAGGLKPRQMDAAKEIAQQLAIGIHHAWLHRELQAYADRLEERVANRTAQLQASEARFRAIFEQSALGIALLNKEGEVMVSNEALQEMLGRSADELTQRSFTDFAPEDEDLREDLAAYRELREGERDHYRVETRYVRPDDEMRWANMMLSLVRDGQGEPQFVIAIVEDITERKRAHEALIQSEKLATTGRLAASLAHEINNPLQTVIGCLGLAEESMEADEDEVEMYVIMAHDELKRAARIVSRLRDLSRPTDREQGELTDVNDLIEEVLEVSRKDLKDHGIRVERQLGEDLPRPFLMPDRVKQVLLNLVLNARDAMSEGGRLTVGSAYDEESDEVVITVADQGAGIPKATMERLFNPFFSTKTEGTGLGLFVSQNIVQEHGGRIEVESTVGEGSTFIVRLPVSAG
jgi:PAS domain S-box-containing protein